MLGLSVIAVTPAQAASYFRANSTSPALLPQIQNVALRVPQTSMIWLVVSSRPTYEEASIVAQSFTPTLGPTLIARSSNGAYAVLAGTLFKDKAKPNLRTLKELRLIPQDAFLSNGDSFDQLVSHSYGNNTSTDLMTQISLVSSVRRLQLALMQLKFYTGATDGLIGPGTVKAFEAYTTAFSAPPAEFLDEYALNSIEQSAQDGFHTAAERGIARSMGFANSEVYAEAMRGGFTSPGALEEAKQKGFVTQRDFDNASRAGFRNSDEYQKGRIGGFETADEYRAASRWQISTRTDYVAFRSSGFSDTDSFLKARERGIADKATYERALTTELSAARLKAGILLQDAQTFIRLNPQIPNLIAIADKAAVLGVTVPSGSTENIEKASSQLLALLTPLVGYTEFVIAREKERAADRHSKVVANQKELESIRSVLTKWVAANISSPKLPQVVQELKLITEAIRLDDLDRLQEARQSVDSLISKNNLGEELNRNPSEAGVVPVSLDQGTTAPFAITPANAILLSGARADVVALYNSSADAPSLVRTLNGEFSFSRGTATVCLFGVDGSPSIIRGLRAVLEPLGATAIRTSTCDSRSPKRVDLLLIGRKAFLEAKPSLAISFIDALEDKKLRLFGPIDFVKLAAKQTEEAALVAEISSGIEANTQKGYGAVEFAASEGELCVATAELVEVHEKALKEVAALVQEPRFAPSPRSHTLEELYPEILRDKCRVFYGPASSLRQLSEALKRDERDFAYLPIWIDESTIATAVARRAAAEEEKIKQAETERLAAEEQAHMELLRRDKEAARRTVVEAELQKMNSPAATGRLTKFTESLKAALF